MAEQRVCNLTATFYSAPDLPPSYFNGVFRAELVDGTVIMELDFGEANHDLVYVIVTGSGALNGIDLTAGDVLHVPPGEDRVFTSLSRRFSAWRLTLE